MPFAVVGVIWTTRESEAPRNAPGAGKVVVALTESVVIRRTLPVAVASVSGVGEVGGTTITVTVSADVPVGVNCTVTFIAVDVSPEITEPELAERVTEAVAEGTSENEGADESTPNPRAATTARATRFAVIDLFNIYFLSLVAIENFSIAAGE
jgi:hypothetical protein